MPAGRLTHRCDRHEAEQVEARRREHVFDEPIETVGRHSPAAGIVGEIHLHEAVDGCLVGAQRVDERRTVDRVDRRRVRAHLPRLLALQLADEVPAHT